MSILEGILSQVILCQLGKDAEKQTKRWEALLNAILAETDNSINLAVGSIWGNTLEQLESLLNMANKIIKGMYFGEHLAAKIDFSPYNASALKIFKRIGFHKISVQVDNCLEEVPHSKEGSFVPINLVMPVELSY